MSFPRFYYPVETGIAKQTIATDICVYGATSCGVTAAIQAARSGKSVALIAFGKHVGGLTTGGLNATDGGNPSITGGIAREFYIAAGYRGFNASLAESIMIRMLQSNRVQLFLEHRLVSVEKRGNTIDKIIMENGSIFLARVYIDCTYEGDLMAMAGISFVTGRESNSTYGETYNGQWAHGGHDFDMKVDPYIIEGKPESGLLWGISSEPAGRKGEGDKRIQAYCFRMHLTDAPNRIPFPKPHGYDRTRYLLLLRYVQSGADPRIRFSKDTNNHHFVNGAFFIDNVGRNYLWPDGSGHGISSLVRDRDYAIDLYRIREEIYQDHLEHQLGMLWFLANDPEIPEYIRNKVGSFGLPIDEYIDSNGWSHELYVREGRRMVSDVVMTEHHCTGTQVVEDPIGLGEYAMDSHHCQRVVRQEAGTSWVVNEGNVEIVSKSGYGISYRSITPYLHECSNLLVPAALSSSHIAYGSIRMEPVFMTLGQSAAVAGCMAFDNNCAVQELEYVFLKSELERCGQILERTDTTAKG